MSVDHQPTIDKLRIIAEMSQAPETKQLCNVMIEYIKTTRVETKKFGFAADDESASTNAPEGR